MFEKISKVVGSVNAKTLQDDVDNYTRFERMRQVWDDEGKSDRMYPFLMSINNSSTGVSQRVGKGYKDLVSISRQKKVFGLKEYSVFEDYISKIWDLSKIFDSINKSFNPEESKQLAQMALQESNKSSFRDGLIKSIDDYAKTTSKVPLQTLLVRIIKQLSQELEDYNNTFYSKMASDVCKKYDNVYKKLSYARERIYKDWFQTSLDTASPITVEMKRAMKAVRVLSCLKDIAADCGDQEKFEMCDELTKMVMENAKY